MRKKHFDKMIIFALLSVFILTSCTNTDLTEELKAKDDIIASLEDDNKTLEERITELEGETEVPPVVNESVSLLSTALEVTVALADDDMTELATFAHPIKGIRFTPYSFVDVANDKVFTATQIPSLMGDTSVYTWGTYDGSGEPIELTFSEYYDKFVFDEDFTDPHLIGNNVLIEKGNSLNNIPEAYPDGEFIEFHFTGFDPQYEGMDWKSLKLVFEEDGGTWYLVGIVHGQWTI